MPADVLAVAAAEIGQEETIFVAVSILVIVAVDAPAAAVALVVVVAVLYVPGVVVAVVATAGHCGITICPVAAALIFGGKKRSHSKRRCCSRKPLFKGCQQGR